MTILDTSEPAATILGGPDLYVDKGSTINVKNKWLFSLIHSAFNHNEYMFFILQQLTCTIRFGNEPPGYIFWYHENKVRKIFFFSLWCWLNKIFFGYFFFACGYCCSVCHPFLFRHSFIWFNAIQAVPKLSSVRSNENNIAIQKLLSFRFLRPLHVLLGARVCVWGMSGSKSTGSCSVRTSPTPVKLD